MKKFLLLAVFMVFMVFDASAVVQFTYSPATVTSISSSTAITLDFTYGYITVDLSTDPGVSYAYSNAVMDSEGNFFPGKGVIKRTETEGDYDKILWSYDGTEITTAGTYTVVIPAGVVGYSDWMGDMYPPYAEEMTFTLTVGSTEGGSGTGGEEGTSGIHSVNGEQLTMNNCDMFNLAGLKVDGNAKGIIIKNGRKILK